MSERTSGGKESPSTYGKSCGGTQKEPISKQRRAAVFVVLACSNVAINMCVSLMAPIFPPVAESKGVSLSIQGWIFGILTLAQSVASPLFGMLIPQVGVKFAFVWGTIFSGGCCVLFGCLVWINDTLTFIIYCFVVRIFLAIGTVTTNTTIFVIVMIVWPDQVAYTLGSLESLVGIGFMLGPAVSGILFDLGGFILPFLVNGIFVVILGVVSAVALPKEPGNKVDSEESYISIFSILRSVEILITTISCCGTTLVWISVDPILQPHLEQFGLSATQVGLIFLIPALTYAITGPLVGKLVDNMDNSLPLMIPGCFALGVFTLFIGPSPLFSLQHYQAVWLIITCLAGMGISIGFGLVPVYERLITCTYQAGYPDNTATMSAIGSLYYLACSIGDFLGPVVATSLDEKYGFQWCTTAVGFLPICLAFSQIGLLMLTRGRTREGLSEKQAVDEEKKLLTASELDF